MKKLFGLFISIFAIFTLTACGGDDEALQKLEDEKAALEQQIEDLEASEEQKQLLLDNIDFIYDNFNKYFIAELSVAAEKQADYDDAKAAYLIDSTNADLATDLDNAYHAVMSHYVGYFYNKDFDLQTIKDTEAIISEFYNGIDLGIMSQSALEDEYTSNINETDKTLLADITLSPRTYDATFSPENAKINSYIYAIPSSDWAKSTNYVEDQNSMRKQIDVVAGTAAPTAAEAEAAFDTYIGPDIYTGGMTLSTDFGDITGLTDDTVAVTEDFTLYINETFWLATRLNVTDKINVDFTYTSSTDADGVEVTCTDFSYDGTEAYYMIQKGCSSTKEIGFDVEVGTVNVEITFDGYANETVNFDILINFSEKQPMAESSVANYAGVDGYTVATYAEWKTAYSDIYNTLGADKIADTDDETMLNTQASFDAALDAVMAANVGATSTDYIAINTVGGVLSLSDTIAHDYGTPQYMTGFIKVNVTNVMDYYGYGWLIQYDTGSTLITDPAFLGVEIEAGAEVILILRDGGFSTTFLGYVIVTPAA